MSDWDTVEKGRLFGKERSFPIENQQNGSCLLPMLEGPLTNLEFGCSYNRHSPESMLGSSSVGHTQGGTLDCNSTVYHGTCGDQLSLPFGDWCILDPLNNSILDSRSRSDSPCLLQDQHDTPTAGMEALLMPPTHNPRAPHIEVSNNGNRQLIADEQLIGSQTSPRNGWLACPWYKKDPWKYHDCAKYKLQRIKDVKQHTYRKHMKPSIYCHVCFKVFTKASYMDEHVQRKSCASRAGPKFDGITEQQRKQLNRNGNRGRDDSEQWYNIWDTIFPGEFRPRSPYLGNDRGEFLHLLRKFWNERRPDIISRVLQTSKPSFETQTIQFIMESIFDLFKAESWSLDLTPKQQQNDVSWEILNLQNPFCGNLAEKQWNDVLVPQEFSQENN